MLRRFKTLRSKFLVFLLIPVIIATVVVTTAFGVLTFYELRHDMLAKQDTIAEQSAASLKAPMWNYDQAQIQQMVAAVADDPDIASVIVRNDQGDAIAQFGEPHTGMIVRKDITHVGVARAYKIGELEISFDMSRVHGAISKQIIQNTLLLISLVVVIIVSAIFANRWIVDRPINRLITAIQQTGEQGGHTVVEWQSQDEIGALIDTYNEMQARLAAEEVRLKKVDQFRKANERRLTLLLDLNKDSPGLSEKQILERALDIAVDITASKVGYLHLLNDDQETLTLSTWNAETLRNCTSAHDDHYPLSKAGIWADSIRERRPVVHNDYQANSDKKGYPEGHSHIERHMSAPVLNADKISLIVGVGNKDSDYEDDDVTLLQAVANDIEKMVMRRRSELALEEKNLELAAARDDAEAASNAKSDFLSMVSHELRTPLTSILGSLGLLKNTTEGMLGKNEEHLFSVAEQNAKRLNALVNDLLDLEKIQSGQLEISQDTIDVPALIRQAVEANAGYAHQFGVHIELTGEQPPAQVIGDKGRLLQVLANLLSNASKFSPQDGYVSVSWDVRTEGEEGDQTVQISVSDEGPGIPEHFRSKLFMPFEQADSSSTRHIGGTGLGLSICKIIVEQHRGAISYETTEGEGTTFFVTLPIAALETT